MKTIAFVLLLGLSACVEVTSPPRDTNQPLRIATWNMEHLAERDGEGCRPRVEADYATMRHYATELGADVIAFQEVESKAAAERVFPRDVWTIVIERRSAAAQGGCRGLKGQVLRAQKVGFAIRKSVAFERNADLRELGLGNDGLRWGVDVTVNGDKPLRLLSIHMKSGCNSGRAATDRDCDVLFAQLPVLERWIDARANETVPFAVLGDWNRRVASRDDALWAEIDDAEPENADLTLAAGRKGATCKAKYSEFIDHIALDTRASKQAIQGSFTEFTYRVPEAQHPSDHCPVSVAIDPTPAR